MHSNCCFCLFRENQTFFSDVPWRNRLYALREKVRWSCGAGLVFLLGIARIELNYCIPFGAQSSDRYWSNLIPLCLFYLRFPGSKLVWEFFLIPNHVLISAFFFQCKSWNSSWSWNKLPLKNPLSFKNIRHLTLSMSDCLTSNSLRAGSFRGFGGGKWGTFSPPALPAPPTSLLAGYTSNQAQDSFCVC